MKIALLFWGLTRSLKYTINSIKTNIFKPLVDSNIDYDIFLHTFYFDGLFTNKRTKEFDINLDFEEYKLLNPDYYLIENQDEIKKQINFKQYKTKKLYYDEQTFDNYILSLHSLKKVVGLLENTNNNYDLLIYLRPDVKFLRPLPIRLFKFTNCGRIMVPRFQSGKGYNDRMFIGKQKQGIIYGNRFDYLLEYSLENRIITEDFVKYIIIKYCSQFCALNMCIRKMDYSFLRIRANGEIAHLDKKIEKLKGF